MSFTLGGGERGRGEGEVNKRNVKVEQDMLEVVCVALHTKRRGLGFNNNINYDFSSDKKKFIKVM